jgi:4-hydroxy-2-oxoheptanedioate aldolase
MLGRELRDCLHAGKRVFGTHVTSLTNPVTAAWQAGFEYDFAFICNEHMPLDRTETSMMCQLYAAKGVSPIVRVPAPVTYEVTMALDGGAQGIVVPYVETVEQVQEMVGAVKYRPIKGKKLNDLLDGKEKVSEKLASFLDDFNGNNYLIIGIESVEAYENLDALISVPGVDGVFVGPHDVTCSMDIPLEWNNPAFVKVINDIIVRCRAANIGVGVHLSQIITTDEQFIEMMKLGLNWVLYGADVAVLIQEMPKRLKILREAMGDTFTREGGDAPPAASCINPGK